MKGKKEWREGKEGGKWREEQREGKLRGRKAEWREVWTRGGEVVRKEELKDE